MPSVSKPVMLSALRSRGFTRAAPFVLKSRRIASIAQEQPGFRGASLAEQVGKSPFQHVPWATPKTTKGTVRFLGPTVDMKPATLDFTQNTSNFGPPEERVVDITDLRDFQPRTRLTTEGIEWVYAPSILSEDKVRHPDKEKSESFVRGEYFDECGQLVKKRTGASKVVPYNFRHRRIEKETNLHDPKKFSGKPIPTFHMDNDPSTAHVNLNRVLGEEEAAVWSKRHWGIVNIWRPIGDVVRQWPLALVDSRSIKYGRDTASIFTLGNYKTHFTALRPQEHYKFYYVSNMTPDEALLFVDYDSARGSGEGDTAVGMAHGAFEDHQAPELAPQRRSIEVRCLVLYD